MATGTERKPHRDEKRTRTHQPTLRPGLVAPPLPGVGHKQASKAPNAFKNAAQLTDRTSSSATTTSHQRHIPRLRFTNYTYCSLEVRVADPAHRFMTFALSPGQSFDHREASVAIDVAEFTTGSHVFAVTNPRWRVDFGSRADFLSFTGADTRWGSRNIHAKAGGISVDRVGRFRLATQLQGARSVELALVNLGTA